MNLEQIRNKLGTLNKPKGQKGGENRPKVDMSLYLWKPKAEGKYQIRIVKSVLDKEFPFKEVFLHYGISKYPIYALTNWGEKDPIIEFAKLLKEGEYDLDKWKLSNKIQPKMRVFAPVIVRGEEEKGVRLWEFGKEIYNQLLQLAEDEDYGDYTDVSEGRDFTINVVKGDVGGREGLKSTVTIKPKTSVLSNDAELVEKWLSEQPDILELQKTFKKTFDQLKAIFEKWLSPEEESSEASNAEASSTENEEEQSPNDGSLSDPDELLPKVDESKAKKAPAKKAAVKKSSYTPEKGKSKGKKFDALFNEDQGGQQ
jgi:hypothetical protein